jgi:sigma-B regulation protein RsbU (phosphoserine phosphatase)
LFIFSKRRQPFNELDVKFITLAAQFFHEKAQRLAAESEVRKSEEKYRRIVETAGEGFLLMDRDLNITDVNEAYCRMVGYSRQALIGKPPFDLASHEYKQFLLLKRDELLSKEYKEFEGVVLAKDGRHVPILVHGNTLTDDQGAVIGNMAFVTDMTEQKKSLELAGEIQKSLLPQKNLRINGLDIAGRSIPCEEIGGDYFDYLLGEEYSNRPFSVVVGDITGHGVDAALLMTSARAFLRMRSAQPGSISQIINEMNHHLTRDVLDTGRFMTLLYMTIDTDNGHLRWVRAGHDPAIVYDPLQDKLEELKGAGLALGLDEKFAYEENLKTELTSGQIIAIGTDGIWEAFNRDGEMYGKERFHSIIRKNASAEAKDILNAIYSDLDSFRSGLKPEDDITLVVIKIA